MNLKKERIKKNLTQKKMAQLLDIETSNYARIERTGKTTLETAYKISKILNKTIEFLFFE